MRPTRLTRFRDLPAWQEAMAVAERVHAATDKLPRKEDNGYTRQVRDSALGVALGIAEAFGGNGAPAGPELYKVARGRIAATQSLIEYGKRVGYLNDRTAADLYGRLTTVCHHMDKTVTSRPKASG